jgi:phospholipase C
MSNDRRSFLKLAASAAALSTLPPNLRAALADPQPGRTGTIQDVEHVVIFMQENRSFDHYFGTLRGVRGFNDPHAITLPGGKPVWYQPKGNEDFTPFHLDTHKTAAQCMADLDHSWKGS